MAPSSIPLRLRPLATVLPLLLLAGCMASPPVEPVRQAPAGPAPAPVVATAALPPPEEVTAPAAAPAAGAAGSRVEPSCAEPPEAAPPELPVDAPPDEDSFGIASYYAKRFEGRRTASGAVYDPDKLTAAHQSFPFGTRVKVVNLRNGREVVVTVTDRCRKRSFPFIDLSRAAARKLGFFGKGITRVQITPLGGEEAAKPSKARQKG